MDAMTAAMRTADLIDAALTPRVVLCEECLGPVEAYTETEMLPGGRADGGLCRDCYRAENLCCAADGWDGMAHARGCRDGLDGGPR